jgi:hypothetical protein
MGYRSNAAKLATAASRYAGEPMIDKQNLTQRRKGAKKDKCFVPFLSAHRVSFS